MFLDYPAEGGVAPFGGKQGIKSRDYLDFVKVAKIIEVKGHLTLEGINRINSLKSGMNSRRIHNNCWEFLQEAQRENKKYII